MNLAADKFNPQSANKVINEETTETIETGQKVTVSSSQPKLVSQFSLADAQ